MTFSLESDQLHSNRRVRQEAALPPAIPELADKHPGTCLGEQIASFGARMAFGRNWDLVLVLQQSSRHKIRVASLS